MIAASIVFWAGAGCMVFAYFGYPAVLMVAAGLQQLRSDLRRVWRRAPRRVGSDGPLPTVAVLVAAHNEQQHIGARVRNLLDQDYPADRLRVYIGSDGSSDATAQIVRDAADPRLTFMDFSARRGKPSVLNDLAALAEADILVLTDANTVFQADTVRLLVRHFAQDDVGCVSGELQLVSAGADAANQDHVYWRYERLLKFLENRLGALLGANGGVYALRRSLFKPIPADAIVDDFWISLQVIEAGSRCVYDPEATALEVTPEHIADEFRRRVRIGHGNYQAMVRFAGLMNPRRGWLAFAFFSHKVLRWMVPHFMLLTLAANLLLLPQPLYVAALALQIAFYGAAAAGWILSRRGEVPAALRIPLFFVSMNMGLLMGFVRFLVGGASGVWSRSAR
ncbi:MAG: glycosyltransferase family 2 protein [Aquabacterium sp.]